MQGDKVIKQFSSDPNKVVSSLMEVFFREHYTTVEVTITSNTLVEDGQYTFSGIVKADKPSERLNVTNNLDITTRLFDLNNHIKVFAHLVDREISIDDFEMGDRVKPDEDSSNA